MTTSYLPYDPQQQFLLPHALQDWLPEGHLAYFISDTVDSLDLSAFHARYAGGGARNQPFHPAMMVKVLVYGYATGVFSSRKLARKLHEDVAFRVLAAGNYPAHRTLCDFRAFHLKELSDLFVQVVKLARECGLVKLGTGAVDGTRIKANASRHKAMSYDRMKKVELELKEQIEALHAGNVQRFDSGLTKIHSLLDTTGSPIYDSRVGAALAMLYELFRHDTARHGVQHDWLGFPSGQPRGRQIRDPGELGFKASSQFHTLAIKREVWARWQLSAGWIIRAVVERTQLFTAEAASETVSHSAVRCHAFEAALFMVGYDLRSLVERIEEVVVGASARNAASKSRASLNWVPAGHTFSTVLRAYREFRETLPTDHGLASLKHWLETSPQAHGYSGFRTSFSSYRYPLRETELNLVDCTLEEVQAIEHGGTKGLDVLTYGELEFVAGDEREQVCFVNAGLAGYCQLIASAEESSNARLIRKQFAGTEQSANTLLSVGRSVGRHFGLLDEKNWPTELFHRFYGDGFEYFRNRLGVGRGGHDLDPR